MNFNNTYSRNDYKYFFQNQFLTDDFKISEEKLSFEFTPQYLKNAFVIGEDKLLELKVLEVLHDSENDPRVGLSKDIFRLMSSYGYKRALVLLHSSKSENYRLSLATIELSLEGSKVKKEYSNPRRYSFFLGPDAKVKTPYNFLITKGRVKDFDDLLTRFSVEVVTKQFYQEIANWYFWAMDKVEFPDDVEKDKEQRNAKSLIRLITRLIFIWFMKEKNLVPKTLFEKSFVDKILNYNDQTGSTYYKAILQNLFFATLNTPMKKDDSKSRIFVEDAAKRGYVSDAHLEQGYYRYSRFIKDKELFLQQFENIPFLNGGLFESLDKSKDLRVDCFSDNPKNETRLKVTDELFFLDKEIEVDISKYVDNGKNKKVTGLLEILNRYNFTIDENTPIDQDIALDPELLGKVFENLLASYNPETATTARKATGSYYTPREIVDYMVNESLTEYLSDKMINAIESYVEIGSDQTDMFGNDGRNGQLKIIEELTPKRWLDKIDELKSEIKKLLSFDTDETAFDDKEKEMLIDAIENVKIIDPACGSGAFPMGILHKLVLALHKLDPDNKLWKDRLLRRVPAEIREETEKSFKNKSIDYIRKLGLIEHCIYGVDIQEIAIQISKLRFFISLLVEQQIDDTKPNRDIRALPNLETKFVAANTLIGLNKPDQLGLVSEDVEIFEKELFNIREELFYTNSRKEKLALQKKEKQIREKLYKALLESRFPNDVAEKITNWDPFDQNTHADWFDAEFMFGVAESSPFGSNGFDIVIGNPPYIQLQKAFNNKIKYADLYKDQNNKTFDRTGDIYCLFYEKGIQLLKRNGLLTYITSNKWMRAGYGEKLREFFTKHNPLQLVDLGPGVFENATVDTNILLIRKRELSSSSLRSGDASSTSRSGDASTTLRSGDASATLAVTLQKEDKDDIAQALQEKGFVLTKLTKDAWFIGNDAEQKLKEKIERIGKPLKDWDVNIYYGIKTGLNEAFIIDTEKRNEILANCSVAESSRFAGKTERERTEEIIKPILRGRDIKRYYYEWAGLWVIGTFPALHLNIDNYPALKKYFLDNFDKRQLEQSGKKYPELSFDARKKTGNKWFETQDQIAYYPEFEKEKVVWQRITQEPTFCLVEPNVFILDSMAFFTGNNLKFIMAILNSKIIYEYVNMIVHQYGFTGFRLSNQYVEVMPIPPITPSNQPTVNQIEGLVDKILEAKKENPQKNTSQWEKEIDELVYKLYDLTEEEIKIIEKGK